MITVRKAGNAYRADTWINGNRVRLSLGTRNHDAAQRLASRIEKALAEGSKSEIWEQLKPILPEFTFNQLASSVGYRPPEIQEELPKPTWSDLRAAFDGYMNEKMALGKFRETTRARYLQTLKPFEKFLSERQMYFLHDIGSQVIGEFKQWRLEQIQKRKESRGGTGLLLDVAILHKVFAVGVKRKMIAENPVEFEGRPGHDPTRGAQPFSSDELARMQSHANKDLLTFLLLRWTGMRGSDVVNLTWSEVHFDGKEIERVTLKRSKRVIVPIQSDLLAILEMENTRRSPDPSERVLLHPDTEKPLSRPRLYNRMLTLGKRAGVSNAHPHRFRDTFAVDMLARGATVYEVAQLLGDSVETVERHYAPFVRELRERVRRMMERRGGGLGAFANAEYPPSANQWRDFGTISLVYPPLPSKPNKRQ